MTDQRITRQPPRRTLTAGAVLTLADVAYVAGLEAQVRGLERRHRTDRAATAAAVEVAARLRTELNHLRNALRQPQETPSP